jgi:hypothetical protein
MSRRITLRKKGRPRRHSRAPLPPSGSWHRTWGGRQPRVLHVALWKRPDGKISLRVRMNEFPFDPAHSAPAAGEALLTSLAARLRSAMRRYQDSPKDVAAIKVLAEEGHAMLQRIRQALRTGADRTAFERFIEGRGRTQLEDRVIVYIEDLDIPIELLYCADPSMLIEPRNFLGMRFLIRRVFMGIQRDEGAEAALDEGHCEVRQLSIGYVGLPDLVHTTLERRFLQEQATAGHIELRDYTDDVLLGGPLAWQQLGPMWGGELEHHFLHVSAHSCVVPIGATESETEWCLVLGPNRTHIPVQDIGGCERDQDFLPIVFVNACRSGATGMDGRDMGGLVHVLVPKLARGCVLSSCDVTDAFAGMYTTTFYRCVLSSDSIGLAMLDARDAIFSEYNDLAVLTYQLHCISPDFAFEVA